MTWTEWMPHREYEAYIGQLILSLPTAKVKYYPREVEGRNNNGILEFRAKLIQLPENCGFISHPDIPDEDFEHLNNNRKKEGFQLVYHNTITYKNMKLHQATWIIKVLILDDFN